jgi:hypothetical protein
VTLEQLRRELKRLNREEMENRLGVSAQKVAGKTFELHRLKSTIYLFISFVCSQRSIKKSFSHID